MVAEQPWGGDERRGIPIHILNYVDEKLSAHTAKVEQMLDSHISEEMERYDRIINNQKTYADAAEKRYAELIRAVDGYAQKAEQFHHDIKGAFLTNRNGDPDFIGHANDHATRVERAEDDKKLMAYVRQQMEGDAKSKEDQRFIVRAVIVALSIGVGGWLLSLAWSGVLVGPK